ncbi:MAG: hypothetical protein KAQ69_03270 [Spirochaetales bacterium]|nr:hypothetical protein [Spirochaetales bacterium]
MRKVVIAGAVRTAIGKFGGALTRVLVTEIGMLVVREAIKRAGVDSQKIDELIMGQVLQVGTGINVARQILLKAGIPINVPAFTVNKVCG